MISVGSGAALRATRQALADQNRFSVKAIAFNHRRHHFHYRLLLAHREWLAVCAATGRAGGGMPAIFIRSAVTAAP